MSSMSSADFGMTSQACSAAQKEVAWENFTLLGPFLYALAVLEGATVYPFGNTHVVASVVEVVVVLLPLQSIAWPNTPPLLVSIVSLTFLQEHLVPLHHEKYFSCSVLQYVWQSSQEVIGEGGGGPPTSLLFPAKIGPVYHRPS